MDTNKMRDLKALAETCLPHQSLRFMHSHGALYIRNDNGIVFDVHQNRSFPDLMAQNKDYADFALACTPATILDLLAEVDRLERKNAVQAESIREYQDLTMGGDVSLGMLKADLRVTTGERDEFKAELAGLRTGYEAQNEVIAGLKAENEALQKDAGRWQCVRNAIQMQSPYAVWREGSHVVLGKDADEMVDNFMGVNHG